MLPYHDMTDRDPYMKPINTKLWLPSAIFKIPHSYLRITDENIEVAQIIYPNLGTVNVQRFSPWSNLFPAQVRPCHAMPTN